MPTRIIREGILTSEAVNSLSERAELFYRRLMSVADDYGRYFSHPGLLRAACYPLRLDSVCEADVKQMLSECISSGLIGLYNGQKHLFIRRFGQQTRSPSKFPEPSANELLIKCKSNVNHLCSESESESETETLPTKLPNKVKSDPKKKLSDSQRICAHRMENCLNGQWENDAGKWVNRIKENHTKMLRVVAEVELAIREQRVTTTPAQYAEQMWKEFL